MATDQVGHVASTNPRRRRFQFSVLTLLALVVLSACLFGLWRALTAPRVSGFVTYHGQPIGSAVIDFEPLDPAGRKVSGVVVDGKYAVKAALLPGRYAVGIRDSREVLPAKYNLPKTSDLSARIQGARDNAINFDLR